MIAWLDGKHVEDAVTLPITGTAFRCGMGVFETILHHGHALPRFEQHLERMRMSLDALDITHGLPGDGDMRRVVLDMALANGLAQETARVNLFCFQNDPEAPASLLVTVTPYTLDPEAVRRLAVYHEAHASHLCAHKTMANMHQRLAWDYARRFGMDDAVLLGLEGCVLEAACAALVFSDGNGFFTTRTPFKLPSLTLKEASRHIKIEEIQISLGSLPQFRHAYWLNSLGGIQPVVQIDTVRYEPDWDTCRPLLRAILGLDA